jgi:hypothetical protein
VFQAEKVPLKIDLGEIFSPPGLSTFVLVQQFGRFELNYFIADNNLPYIANIFKIFSLKITFEVGSDRAATSSPQFLNCA